MSKKEKKKKNEDPEWMWFLDGFTLAAMEDNDPWKPFRVALVSILSLMMISFILSYYL